MSSKAIKPEVVDGGRTKRRKEYGKSFQFSTNLTEEIKQKLLHNAKLGLLVIVTIIVWITPDPLPIIDEILLAIITWLEYKSQ